MASAEKGPGTVTWYGYGWKLITEGSTEMKTFPAVKIKLKNNS